MFAIVRENVISSDMPSCLEQTFPLMHAKLPMNDAMQCNAVSQEELSVQLFSLSFVGEIRSYGKTQLSSSTFIA